MAAWSFRAAATLGLLGVAAFFVVLLVEPFGTGATIPVDDWACAVVPVVAGLASLARHRRRAPDEGPGWLLLGLACILWGGGGTAWASYEVVLGRAVPYPSLADAGYLLSVPFSVVAMVSISGGLATFRGGLRTVLDASLAAGALLFLSWATVLAETFDQASGGWLYNVVLLAYPISDVVITTIVVLALAGARGERRLGLALIGIGLASVALSDSSFAWFVAHGDYVTGNLFDAGYVLGYVLIGLAALRPAPVDGVTLGAPATRVELVLPCVPLAVVGVVAVGMHVRGTEFDPFLFWIGLFLVTVVLGRQLLSLFANQELSRDLQTTVGMLREREAELQYQAFHDSLTGLPNRALYAEHMARAVAGREQLPVFAMLLDLDGFKQVNDTLGHPAGDRLLIVVADRLRLTVRVEDVVARLGGDEFAILMSPTATVESAHVVAGRILETLRQPADLGAATVAVRGSLGLVEARQGDTLDDILRHADMAMYEAKRGGKDRFVVRSVPRPGDESVVRNLTG